MVLFNAEVTRIHNFTKIAEKMVDGRGGQIPPRIPNQPIVGRAVELMEASRPYLWTADMAAAGMVAVSASLSNFVSERTLDQEQQ
ncbi:hypothetical protein N7463_003628 [Penicillium fimorum]|uniref:Uncharacterized protein n=1 Tax=Penicillium fimorum TaxID=1882269 RepID=A0A9W9Y1I9_9EURO|nr:hypothetical protein N7463_003628 [Penicillium fimorum]